MSRFLGLLLLACLALGANLAKAEDPFGRAATPAEVIGAWERMPYPAAVAKEINRVNAWPLPFQYFLMLEDGRINWIMSRARQIGLTRQGLLETLERLPWNRYKARPGRMEIDYPASPEIRESWRIDIVTRDLLVVGLPHRKGDLVMSLEVGGSEIIYYRTLRKLVE